MGRVLLSLDISFVSSGKDEGFLYKTNHYLNIVGDLFLQQLQLKFLTKFSNVKTANHNESK